ncbi:MAG: hypothetical protein J0H02_01880 [Armatimonadetes bacterium]|nr:hypothetical protein [Armatimonadota bacterium]
MSELVRELSPELFRLVEQYNGFIIREERDQECFGNAEVQVEVGSLYLRALRDRGVVSLDVSADDVNWYRLDLLLKVLNAQKEMSLPMSPDDQIRGFEKKLGEIQAFFIRVARFFKAVQAA